MDESVSVAIPRENVNDETAMLVAWLVADGQRVERGQHLATIETSKATLDLDAPVGGLVQHVVRESEEVPIGTVICHISSDEALPPSVLLGPARNGDMPAGPQFQAEAIPIALAAAAPPFNSDAPSSGASAPPGVRFSHKARELLEQVGLDLLQFEGRGLVRSHDVLRAQVSAGDLAAPAVEARADAPAAPSALAAAGVAYRMERLPRTKRAEGRHLRWAHEATLTSTVTVACPTRGFRAAAGSDATAIILFEVARLLRKYSALNAFYANGNAHYYEDVHLGIAVDSGRGLKVPVIRHADRKGITEIAGELQELVVAYMQDALPVEALAGGTFTVTDLSGEGVFLFHPLIPKGQSAILGVGSEATAPGGGWGAFHLILAFDHQIAEGRYAAQFLNDLGGRLEAHEASLMGGAGPGRGDEGPRCARCGMMAGELEMYGQYIIQSIRPDGRMRLICTNCLKGY